MNLLQFREFISDEDAARAFVQDVRWPDEVTCPRCGSPNIYWHDNHSRWRCKASFCRLWFSERTGTLFEKSQLPLLKCLVGMFVFVSNSRGVSTPDLSRYLNVSQKTGFYYRQRLRESCRMDRDALADVVRVLEVHLSGKERSRHLPNWHRRQLYRPLSQMVLGLFDQGDRLVHLGVSSNKPGECAMDVLASTLEPGVVTESRSAHVLGVIDNKSIGDVFWPIRRMFTSTQLGWG